MEYFVVDKNWVGLLVTKDLIKLEEFLDNNQTWETVLKRENIGDNWIFVTNKLNYDYDLRGSSIF